MATGQVQPPAFTYSGTDNLDVMACATNYNNAIIRSFARHCPGVKRVLDFGSGTGTFARLLRQNGYEVQCLEPDAVLCARLKEQTFPVYHSLESVPDSTFEAVISLNVFEHIENDAAALKGVFAKLKPGGLVYIYVPAFMVLYTSMDKKVGHFRRYSKRMLLDLASKCGFTIKHIRYADSLGYFATLLFKLVGNKEGNIEQGSIQLYDRAVFPVSNFLDGITGRLFGKNLVMVAAKN